MAAAFDMRGIWLPGYGVQVENPYTGHGTSGSHTASQTAALGMQFCCQEGEQLYRELYAKVNRGQLPTASLESLLTQRGETLFEPNLATAHPGVT